MMDKALLFFFCFFKIKKKVLTQFEVSVAMLALKEAEVKVCETSF